MRSVDDIVWYSVENWGGGIMRGWMYRGDVGYDPPHETILRQHIGDNNI